MSPGAAESGPEGYVLCGAVASDLGRCVWPDAVELDAGELDAVELDAVELDAGELDAGAEPT